jgi:hypothetical protein
VRGDLLQHAIREPAAGRRKALQASQVTVKPWTWAALYLYRYFSYRYFSQQGSGVALV